MSIVQLIIGLALLAATASGIGTKPPSEPVVIQSGMGPVLFLRFSPDGRELARVCQWGNVELLDTSSFDKARTFAIGMRMVAYSADGSRIATAEGIDGARVWDAAAPGTPRSCPAIAVSEVTELDSPLRVLQAPSSDRAQRVFWAEFSPDGTRLITTHATGHVKVWDTQSWAVVDDVALTTTEVRTASFTPDGTSIVFGDTEGVLRRWNLKTRAATKTWETPNGGISGILFSPDGKTLVTIHHSDASSVFIWYSVGGLAQVETGFGAAAFSQDGRILALGGRRLELLKRAGGAWTRFKTIELSAMPSDQLGGRPAEKRDPAEKISALVTALAFSPDGETLAAGCVDGTVRLVKITPPTRNSAK